MSNLRFYHPENLKIGATVKLSDNAAAHAVKVMRLNVNATLTVILAEARI